VEEQRKQAELNRKEEELRRREEEMRKKEEERKNKALEAKQVEDARLLLEKLELEKKVKLQEEESHKKEQERLQKEWEERMKSLRAAEESIRRAETERKLAEDNRREELRLKEEALKQKAMEEERRLTKLREEEAKRLEKKRLEFEEELRIAEQRRQEEALRAQREQLLLLEKEAAQQKAEQERNAQRRVLEEERRALEERVRLENERMAIQKERAALEAAVKMQEALVEKKKQEEERRRQEQEEARIKAEREKEELLLRQKREYEELRLKAQRELEELRKEEERKLLAEEEAARRAEQELLDRQREQEERERLQREEAEAKRQEEELKAKEARQLAYEQMAASAVFIPPKTQSPQGTTLTATVVGDTVVCDWDLPEGNISPTNWIGLYPVRALTGTKKYTHFAYTNNTSAGQHVFKGVTPGHYEVRFFATKAYDHIARSAPVLVGPVATIIPQVQGDHVLVHYTLSPLSSAPTREWVGIYEKGQRRNKLYISTAYGNPEGQVMMKAPRNPGEYEVRLFANGSVYNEQAKAEFTVVDADCINVEPASVLAGANVSVSWILRTLEPSTGDWIGLYRADEQNNSNYLSCTYTNGSSVNSSTIAAPKEAGVYEFRLFSKAKGKYTTHRASGPLIVM
jgi:murein DD-endopeptidase MepM/ murein hydrolase activator NlpD